MTYQDALTDRTVLTSADAAVTAIASSIAAAQQRHGSYSDRYIVVDMRDGSGGYCYGAHESPRLARHELAAGLTDDLDVVRSTVRRYHARVACGGIAV